MFRDVHWRSPNTSCVYKMERMKHKENPEALKYLDAISNCTAQFIEQNFMSHSHGSMRRMGVVQHVIYASDMCRQCRHGAYDQYEKDCDELHDKIVHPETAT